MDQITRNIEVKLSLGLHTRPAAVFSHQASQFQSKIFISKNGNSVDAKSILGVMSLGIHRNEIIEVSAYGIDAQEAIEALNEVLSRETVDEYRFV